MYFPLKHLPAVLCLVLQSLQLGAQSHERIQEDLSSGSWYDIDILEFEPFFLKSLDMVKEVDLDEKTRILYAVVHRISDTSRIRGIHQLMAYCLSAKKVLWVYNFGDSPTRFVRVDTIPMITTAGATWAIHPRTGLGLWSADLEISKALSGNRPFAIGYQALNKKVGSIKGLDPLLGKVQWQYDFSNASNSGSVAMLNDTALLILGNGLHHVNLQKGEALVHNVYHDLNLVKPTALSSAVEGELLSKAKSFTNAGSSTSKSVLGRKLVNVAINDGIIYHAGANSVKAFELNGKERWTFIGPKVLSGMSKLFFHNAHLYLVNYGAIPGSGAKESSELYIAKIDPADGSLEASSESGILERVIVNDFLVLDSSVVIMMNGRMAELDLDNLGILVNEPFGKIGMIEGIRRFIKPPYYIYQEGKLEHLSETQPDLIIMQYTIALNLAIKHARPLNAPVKRDELFTYTRHLGNHTHLSNGEDLLIIDENHQLLPLRFSAHMRVYNDYICDWRVNRIVLLPIETLGAHQ